MSQPRKEEAELEVVAQDRIREEVVRRSSSECEPDVGRRPESSLDRPAQGGEITALARGDCLGTRGVGGRSGRIGVPARVVRIAPLQKRYRRQQERCNQPKGERGRRQSGAPELAALG